MGVASKARLTSTWSRRLLLEQVRTCAPPGQPALKVDEQAGVIFRVKVLGRYSRNNHGLTEAENGSEYTPACQRAALAMYEGSKVKVNHPPDRTRPAQERDVDDTFGVLRNCVIESDEHNEPAIWADLHYLTTHPLAPRVVEDVKKGLGVYGLSHNAAAKRERFDRAQKRLLIEELAVVRSVDLVDKPATNRNLWESENPAVTTTFRDLLESQRKRFSANRLSWMDRLLEMYEDDDPAMAASAEAPAADPDEALAAGFRAAIMAVVDDRTMNLAAKKKKIGDLLGTQDKLAQKDEPAEAPESEGGSEDDEEKPKEKTESEAENVVKLKAENAKLKAENAVRNLCESEGFAAPNKTQLKALVLLESDAERKELIAGWKAQPAGGSKFRTPKSAPPGSTGKKPAEKAREVQESEAEAEKAKLTNAFAILRRY